MQLKKLSSRHISYYLLGERALVLELAGTITLDTQQKIWGLAEHLSHHHKVREVVPGMNNLTIILDESQGSAKKAIDWLQQLWEKSEALVLESRYIEISVCYGGEVGPDLDEVAAHAELSAKQVVECHSSKDYIVYFLGFQPGFAYMGGMSEQIAMPRRSEPRLSVPAGSVGIGGSQTGVYPLDTPGGWQIIGRTSLALFTPNEMPPTLLRPGDSVRFVPTKAGVC